MYDTRTWKRTGTVLAGHALTITKLTFSHDDRWLLSVSRDRTWHLYEYVEGQFHLRVTGLISHSADELIICLPTQVIIDLAPAPSRIHESSGTHVGPTMTAFLPRHLETNL